MESSDQEGKETQVSFKTWTEKEKTELKFELHILNIT